MRTNFNIALVFAHKLLMKQFSQKNIVIKKLHRKGEEREIFAAATNMKVINNFR